MNNPVLHVKNIFKSFQEGSKQLDVLTGVSFDLEAGKVVSLLGPSGSGKSTLLHIAGLLERPNAGRVIINQQDASTLSDRKRTHLRCQTIGFVYQFHHLLPEFTAHENVILPQLLNGASESAARQRASALLEKVGLKERLTHLPSQLSGGEQQRVAIARAIANSPRILLADEPTGNLDTHTSAQIFKMILELAHTENLAALIVTHNPELASKTDQIMTMENGKLLEM